MLSSPHTEVRPITRDQGTHERAAEYRSWGEERGVTQNRNTKRQTEKLHIGSFDEMRFAFRLLFMSVQIFCQKYQQSKHDEEI